jgi:UDP-glucose 4-epimerase
LGGLNVLEAASQYDVPGVNIAVGNYFENNTYSISKSTIERFCLMFQKERKTRVSVMRAFNAYGPRQAVAPPYGASKVRKIMPSFVMRALHGDAIEIYGDGLQIMDMVYVADVARDLVDCLEQTIQVPYQEVLQSGTGLDITVNMVAEAVVEETGAASEIRHLPMRPGETPGTVVKASNPFGKSYMPLKEGVRRTVEFYRATL